MTIFEVLRCKHPGIAASFDELDAGVSREVARAGFAALASRIAACLRAERAVLFPRVRARSRGSSTDELAEATRYHEVIERALERLRVEPLADDAWRAGLGELRQQLVELATTEEWTIFPLASLAFSNAELCAIASELLACEPREAVVAGVTISYTPAEAEPPPALVVAIPPAPPVPADFEDEAGLAA